MLLYICNYCTLSSELLFAKYEQQRSTNACAGETVGPAVHKTLAPRHQITLVHAIREMQINLLATWLQEPNSAILRQANNFGSFNDLAHIYTHILLFELRIKVHKSS